MTRPLREARVSTGVSHVTVNLIGRQGVLSYMVELASDAIVPRDGLLAVAVLGAAEGVARDTGVPIGSMAVQAGAAADLSQLHRVYYRSLVAYAGLYLGALADAEDAVSGGVRRGVE